MIATLVFSKDRPAQLDLLLRSVQKRLPDLRPITVLWKATDRDYQDGYTICEAEHPQVIFERDRDFRAYVLWWLATQRSEYVTTLCDDDVATAKTKLSGALSTLRLFDAVLCFSLRLGANCVACYPLRAAQALPELLPMPSPFMRWRWTESEGDFSYPGSLDGHLWRKDELTKLVTGGVGWDSPNQLEDALMQACKGSLLPQMASFRRSVLTGCPVNLVQTTHPNRHGEQHPRGLRELNRLYLTGKRLALPPPDVHVDAAHTELPLEWAA